MLEVHPPHERVHSWAQFFVHIAAIVIGLIIAVSLEQTVEFFHHRHQREQLEAALQRDGRANREYIKGDIAKAQGVLDWALEQASAMERAGPTGPLTLRRIPHGFIGSPDAGVWPSAKASGVATLLPASAQNWFEYLAEDRRRHLSLRPVQVDNCISPTLAWIKRSSAMPWRLSAARSMSQRSRQSNVRQLSSASASSPNGHGLSCCVW